MRPIPELAMEIRSAITTYEDFHKLKRDCHLPLLRDACRHLLQMTVEQVGLDPRKKTRLIGPETMGEIMVKIMQEDPGEYSDLEIVTMPKLSRETYGWRPERPETSRIHQSIWVDDSLKYGLTLKESLPVLREQNVVLSAVAVLANHPHMHESTIPENKIACIETWRPE